jgi:hypothetical protein
MKKPSGNELDLECISSTSLLYAPPAEPKVHIKDSAWMCKLQIIGKRRFFFPAPDITALIHDVGSFSATRKQPRTVDVPEGICRISLYKADYFSKRNVLAYQTVIRLHGDAELYYRFRILTGGVTARVQGADVLKEKNYKISPSVGEVIDRMDE